MVAKRTSRLPWIHHRNDMKHTLTILTPLLLVPLAALQATAQPLELGFTNPSPMQYSPPSITSVMPSGRARSAKWESASSKEDAICSSPTSTLAGAMESKPGSTTRAWIGTSIASS